MITQDAENKYLQIIGLHPEFTWQQKWQILEGVKKGLDVNIYAKPDFNCQQMEQIRLGLEEGLDVSLYANPELNYIQMDVKRADLNTASQIYDINSLDEGQKMQVVIGRDFGLTETQISEYAKYHDTLDEDQMAQIRVGVQSGISPDTLSVLAESGLTAEDMDTARRTFETVCESMENNYLMGKIVGMVQSGVDTLAYAESGQDIRGFADEHTPAYSFENNGYSDDYDGMGM